MTQISFLPKVNVGYVVHKSEYTAEEVQNSWYSKADLEAIKKTAKKTATEASVGLKVKDDVRGLESMTPQGAAMKKGRRLAAMNAVLDEQDLLDEGALLNDARIRAVYTEHSHAALALAQVMGTSDQYMVKSWKTTPLAMLGMKIPKIEGFGGTGGFARLPQKIQVKRLLSKAA